MRSLEPALLNEARTAAARGRDQLYSQLNNRPAWSAVENGPLCEWTTGQILNHVPPRTDDEREKAAVAVAWLEEQQNPDGSWSSATRPGNGNTPATANVTMALLGAHGAGSVAADRGLAWIRDAYHDGWSAYHGRAHDGVELHAYSTASAIRALCMGPRSQENRAIVAEALHLLLAAGTDDETFGWGWNTLSPLDATFTSFALHGIHDAVNVWGMRVGRDITKQAIDNLVASQRHDGFWADWRGNVESSEATAYALFTLLSWNSEKSGAVSKATRALLANQLDNGAWGSEGGDPVGKPWITWLAVMALERVSAAPVDGPAGFEPPGTPLMIQPRMDVPPIYRFPTLTQIDGIPKTRSLDHTMGDALDPYVARKVPAAQIKQAVAHDSPIEVHGIFPPDAPDVLGNYGYTEVRKIGAEHPVTSKRWNTIRPTFYEARTPAGEEAVICAVIPGVDYVHHYAALIRHHALTYGAEAERLIKVMRYRSAEEAGLPVWSWLPDTLIQPGDRVVLGYVDEILDNLGLRGAEEVLGTNGYYGMRRERVGSSNVVFLGVQYSYWGSISGHLVAELCRQGASEIIYVAKLGSMTKPADLYRRIYVPSDFAFVQHARLQLRVSGSLPNGILKMFPGSNSGLHISVPTVLEEDYKQRGLADSIQANSIDNEIAHMAWAVANHNEGIETPISFSAVHFATDYVRGQHEKELPTAHDLAKNRDEDALTARKDILRMISQTILRPYFGFRRPES